MIGYVRIGVRKRIHDLQGDIPGQAGCECIRTAT